MNFFSIGSYLFGRGKKNIESHLSTEILDSSDKWESTQSLNSDANCVNNQDKHGIRKRCIPNHELDYSESGSEMNSIEMHRKKRSCNFVNHDYERKQNDDDSESNLDDNTVEGQIENDSIDVSDDHEFNLLSIFRGDFLYLKASNDLRRNNVILKTVLLKNIREHSQLNRLLSLVIIEYFLYHFQPSLVVSKVNWPNLLNFLGNTSCY